jgi:signal peptidase
MILPLGIFYFIDSLYETKRRYALGQTSRTRQNLSKIFTVMAAIIMIGVVMLISNQFYYGSFVIATDSMTGEINKGDMVIYERYEDQLIIEGQVIVFEKNKSMIVHRVADIKIINGVTRYYTKGDANEDLDAGYITDSNIVGLVNYKIPFVGYPSIWVHSLFKN